MAATETQDKQEYTWTLSNRGSTSPHRLMSTFFLRGRPEDKYKLRVDDAGKYEGVRITSIEGDPNVVTFVSEQHTYRDGPGVAHLIIEGVIAFTRPNGITTVSQRAALVLTKKGKSTYSGELGVIA